MRQLYRGIPTDTITRDIFSRCIVMKQCIWYVPKSKSRIYNPNIYSSIVIDKIHYTLHRVIAEIYILEEGEQLDPFQEVCHTCDMKRCIAPWHLVVADHSYNMRDAWNKHGNGTLFHSTYQYGPMCLIRN